MVGQSLATDAVDKGLTILFFLLVISLPLDTI